MARQRRSSRRRKRKGLSDHSAALLRGELRCVREFIREFNETHDERARIGRDVEALFDSASPEWAAAKTRYDSLVETAVTQIEGYKESRPLFGMLWNHSSDQTFVRLKTTHRENLNSALEPARSIVIRLQTSISKLVPARLESFFMRAGHDSLATSLVLGVLSRERFGKNRFTGYFAPDAPKRVLSQSERQATVRDLCGYFRPTICIWLEFRLPQPSKRGRLREFSMRNAESYAAELETALAIADRREKSESERLRKRYKVDETTIAAAAAYFDKTRDHAESVKTEIREQMKLLGVCPYCGGPLGDTPHADHIHPVSLGGFSVPENMIYICVACNLAKSNKTLREFIRDQGIDRAAVESRLETLGKRF